MGAEGVWTLSEIAHLVGEPQHRLIHLCETVSLTHSSFRFFPRYLLPIIPFAALLVGRFLVEVTALTRERFGGRWRQSLAPAVCGLVTVALVWPQAVETIEFDRLMALDDTRAQAYRLIIERFEPGTRVVSEVREIIRLPPGYGLERWSPTPGTHLARPRLHAGPETAGLCPRTVGSQASGPSGPFAPQFQHWTNWPSLPSWQLGHVQPGGAGPPRARNARRNRLLCSAPGFLDSGLTVFASTLPLPARRGHVAPGRGFDSGTSPASTARCTSA